MAALVGANGPMVALGISDPRDWGPADWVSDIVPHLAFGFITAATYRGFRQRGSRTVSAVVQRGNESVGGLQHDTRGEPVAAPRVCSASTPTNAYRNGTVAPVRTNTELVDDDPGPGRRDLDQDGPVRSRSRTRATRRSGFPPIPILPSASSTRLRAPDPGRVNARRAVPQ